MLNFDNTGSLSRVKGVAHYLIPIKQYAEEKDETRSE